MYGLVDFLVDRFRSRFANVVFQRQGVRGGEIGGSEVLSSAVLQHLDFV